MSDSFILTCRYVSFSNQMIGIKLTYTYQHSQISCIVSANYTVLPSSFVSRHLNIKTRKTTTLPHVSRECKLPLEGKELRILGGKSRRE
jgi:hypothetical protein